VDTARSGGPVHFPVPWGDGPRESFLVAGEQLRAITEAAGFASLLWHQGEDTLPSIASAARGVPALGDDHGLGLHLLMPDFEARMAGLARNVGEQRIELVQAVFIAR